MTDTTQIRPGFDWTPADAPDALSGPESAVDAETPRTPDRASDVAPGAGERPQEQPVVKFAIVGFTPTAGEALPLLTDPAWEVWGMNNLHLQPGFAGRGAQFDAWFDLHPSDEIAKDAPHAAWLSSGADGVPVWTWEPRDEWPTTRRYPREEVVQRFGRYFTNTVSWQIALALLRIMAHSPDGKNAPPGASIAIFGVDMATSSEYSAQRPSVEYHLGIAAGAGIEVILPQRSDLLKCAQLYGEDGGGFRAMLDERMELLNVQLAEHEQAAAQHTAAVHACRGALEQVKYISGVWTQPNITRVAVSQDGQAPSTDP